MISMSKTFIISYKYKMKYTMLKSNIFNRLVSLKNSQAFLGQKKLMDFLKPFSSTLNFLT